MTSTFKIGRGSVVPGSLVEIVELPKLEDLMDVEEEVVEIEEDTEQVAVSRDEILDSRIEEKKQELQSVKDEIEECKKEALNIIEEAKKQATAEAEGIRLKAREQGINDAQTQIKAQLDEQELECAKLMSGLRAAVEEQNERVQQGILSVAIEIARKIIKIELDRNDDAFMGLIRDTAKILRQDKKRVMRLCVKDYTRYFTGSNEKNLYDMQAMGIDIVRDTLLGPGDCILETGYGNVNTGIKKQLDRIEENLKEEI